MDKAVKGNTIRLIMAWHIREPISSAKFRVKVAKLSLPKHLLAPATRRAPAAAKERLANAAATATGLKTPSPISPMGCSVLRAQNINSFFDS